MRSPFRRAPRLADDQVRATWQVASLLLDYPDDEVAVVEQVVPALPERVRAGFESFLAHRAATPLGELRATYVETFDTRRRGNLFLTYFLHGDTRRRGMALLRFREVFDAAGMELTGDELPDHLCVVLEFGACCDLEAGRALLLDHRAGVEVLRRHLAGIGSPWIGVLEAVLATLPPLAGDEEDAVRRLAAAGPPKEEVGLTPYGTPAFDAKLAEQVVDLPMPAVRGR